MMNSESIMVNESVEQSPINLELKKILQTLNLPINITAIVDLKTVCGMDLQTVKEIYPTAKTIAITKPDNKDKLHKRFDEVLAINIEKDCLPFPSKTIDVILADNVLNQAKEVFWIIHEATRSLRIAGYLILGVPVHNTGQFSSYEEIMNFLNRGYPNGYEIVFSEKNRFHYLPSWLARIANYIFPTKKATRYLVLQKTQPYISGFLDYKISTDANK